MNNDNIDPREADEGGASLNDLAQTADVGAMDVELADVGTSKDGSSSPATPLLMLDFFKAKMPEWVKVTALLSGWFCFLASALMLTAAIWAAVAGGSVAYGLAYMPEAGLVAIFGILILFRKSAFAAGLTTLYGIANIINVFNVDVLFAAYAWLVLVAGIIGLLSLLVFSSAWRTYKRLNSEYFTELAEKPRREAREELRLGKEKAAADRKAREEARVKKREERRK